MRILIIGAAGFLGKRLVADFSGGNEVFAADKRCTTEELFYVDLASRELVREAFLRFRPEVAILPASITAVDFCERNQEMAWMVNAEGPKEAAVAAKRQGAFLVFYSSDYIFDGAKGPYMEDDRPNPINFYGKTKLEAERIIRKELDHFLIVRTCGLYGYEKDGLNFAMQVRGDLSAGKTISVPADQFGTPTYVEDLSRITLKLVRDKREGVFNASGPDYVNRVEFASEVADVFRLDKSLIRGLDTKDLNQPAPRPKRGGLRIDKLRAEAGLETMGLREGLIAMKDKIA
ncbi:MAG: NAD(P)-dependent oxidoreductase [Candidatus Omnitrophica bacterium]|nr:NAD(P)-dependent oxidoreductase [Candidatus Omnitrophota bacterium]